MTNVAPFMFRHDARGPGARVAKTETGDGRPLAVGARLGRRGRATRSAATARR